MIDKTDFDIMIGELSGYDKLREELIKKSRDVLKLAKLLTYSLHRSEPADGNELMAAKTALDLIARNDPHLFMEGSYSAAMQEYAEAMTYLSFVRRDKLQTAKELGISVEDYLMALSDLTGELCRRCVREATAGNKAEAARIKEFLEALEGQLIRFDFRNGELRRKFDAVKWNLKKVEEVLYDLR